MTQPPTGLNHDATTALQTLAGRLSDADLSRDLGEGWDVATALAHAAFWDERARLILDRYEQGLDTELPDDWYDDVLNEALLPLWRALAPREALRLILEAAEAVDERIATLPPELLAGIEASNASFLVNRHRHRREHIDQIESALGA